MINRKSIVNSPDDRLRQFNRMPIPNSDTHTALTHTRLSHTHGSDTHIWQMRALWSEILPPSLLQGGHWFTAMTDVAHSIIITSPSPAPDRVNAHTHTHTHTHTDTHTPQHACRLLLPSEYYYSS